MKGPLKLSLAIALALTGSQAFALGLGTIQVKSGLNQPLDAEIPVIAASPAEAAGLSVALATAEDFQRVGLNRARVNVPVEFSVTTNSRGQSVIKVTTKEAVREPFLDFLLEVNWPKGKLLREYTVLLDPPVTAPAVKGSSATMAPAKETPAASTQKLVEEKPAKSKNKPSVEPPKSKPAEPAPKPVAAKTPSKPASAPTRAAGAGDYGPVAQGETLSEVARATLPDDRTNVNQMMLALLKTNPNAFFKDNINALKRGAILRIPSADEIKATGSLSEAAAAVRNQNEAWTSGAGAAPSKPTLVATAGTPPAKQPAAKPVAAAAPAKPEKAAAPAKPNEHLALVPPRAGKDSQASADRPGAASGTGKGNADAKAELARTKEALTSREQEVTELKSRVKELEDLKSKDARYITLKDSEIAELQKKLRELDAAKTAAAAAASKSADLSAAAAPKPAATAAAATPEPAAGTKQPPKLTAQDIWGSLDNDKGAGTKAGAATPGSTPSSATGTATPSTSATTPSTGATTPTPGATTPGTTPTAPIGATTASGTGTAATTPSAVTPPATASAPSTPGATSTLLPAAGTVSAPTSSTPVSPSATPPKPAASTTPIPSKPAPTVAPLEPPPGQPFYMNSTVLLGGGAVLLIIGLLALMRFMRKPKMQMAAAAGAGEELAAYTSEDERHLLDELAQRPGDPGLSLELLSHYYAQREGAKFEAAAEAMYAHIADPTQPEWQQVKAMGEELCPHNPLFGGEHDLAHMAGDVATEHRDDLTGFHFDEPADRPTVGAQTHAAAAVDEDFDFDLTDQSAVAAPAKAPAAAHDVGLDLGTIGIPAQAKRAEPAPSPAPAAAKPAEDFFTGEDAIGTKLDLAKAYLDMGDPEGAKSMLDEVLAEGNDAQKGEARKLMAEIK